MAEKLIKNQPTLIGSATRLEAFIVSGEQLPPISPDDALRLSPKQISSKYNINLFQAQTIHTQAELALDRIAAG